MSWGYFCAGKRTDYALFVNAIRYVQDTEKTEKHAKPGNVADISGLIELMIARGIEQKLYSQVRKKMEKYKAPIQIAEELEEDYDKIKEIYDKILEEKECYRQ